MPKLKKQVTFFHTDKIEYQTLEPVAQEARERGYEVIFTDDIMAKAEIGIYCQHECHPENSKLSIVMLHDLAQRHYFWPNFWRAEPWSNFDVAIVPGDDWAERWRKFSWYPPARPRNGVYKLGWPKADLIFKNKAHFDAEVKKIKDSLNLKYDKTILYAPSWENDGKQDEFVRSLKSLPVNLLLKQAQWPDAYPQILENIRKMNEIHRHAAPQVHIIDPNVSIMYCLGLSDIIVSEESSVVVEALLLNVPSIAVMDWRIPDMQPPRLPEVPLEFVIKTTKDKLKHSVSEILADMDSHKSLSNVRDRYFSVLGKSSRKIIDLIDGFVTGKDSGLQHLAPVFPSSIGKRYTADSRLAVWVTPEHKQFSYSDGEAEEKYIYQAIRTTRDVSCSSNELTKCIKDWPSEYHLSPARRNLLAPLTIGRGSKVLELGCGMGAVTRYLGELGAEVTAVEGSLRRAAIARERCRDLPNVTIVCDNFKDFQSAEHFDIVTLIGVMEYSPKFIGGNAPVEECIRIAQNYLNPDGALVIAIENRLGLKYWNNCAEDHTGQMFESIQDTYPSGSVTTFGYEELKKLLSAAGLGTLHFFFPFPDYKLPTVIIRDSALQQQAIDFATIIGQTRSRDYSGQPYRHFSERLAWKTLEKNGLIPSLANSFLVVCNQSGQENNVASGDWIAKIYNSYRSACYRTETTIYPDQQSGAIRVAKERTYGGLPEHEGPLVFNREIENNYIRGSLLSDEILMLMQQHNPVNNLCEKIKEYKDAVIQMSKKAGVRPGFCPGELVDCTPFNLIRTNDGSFHYIDNEWIAKDDVPLNFILLRGVVGELTAKITFFKDPSTFAKYANIRELVSFIFRNIHQPLTASDIEYFCRNEAVIQAQVTGAPQDESRIAQQFRTLFTAPINDALGIALKLSIWDIFKLQRKGLPAKEHLLQTPSSQNDIQGKNATASVRQTPVSDNGKALAVKSDTLPNCISIIILTFNQLAYTKECVNSLRKHTPESHEIIFVDNGSTDGTVKWLKKLTQENNNYKLIDNQQNFGFARGCNQGIEASAGEFILLLNNDVVVAEGWLSGLLECLKHAPDAGIVGPMTNSISGPQQINDDSYRSADYLDKYAAQFREKYLHRRIPLRRVVGFCMLFKRALAEQIGLLDESFGTGNFEDDDFCLRAALAGFKNYIAGDIFIHHYGSRSFIGNKINYGAAISDNRKIIDKKWTLNTASPEGRKLAVLRATELADDYYAKGKIDQAVEALINCIKYAPDNPQIYYELTRFFIESKRFSEAWEVVGTMPEAARNHIRGLEYTGYAKEGLGLDDEATSYADKMSSLDNNYPPALNLQGILAYKKDEKEKATDYFMKAIAADPGYGEAYTNLGVICWGIEKKDEALLHLKKGFMLSPTLPDSSSLFYSVVSSLGIFTDAEADFREASKLYPHHKILAFLFIDLLIQQGKFDLAILKIEDALALFGLDDGILKAALAVRDKIGPLKIAKNKKNTLSLCMIVKNEEKHLVRCLRSVRDVVDEIIIVDTGSTDKTIDIAKVFGAKLFDFPWTGNFSEARNQSFTHATGDWILVLDADEVIAACQLDELKSLIRKRTPSPVAYSIDTRNYTNNTSCIGWTPKDGQYSEEAGAGWINSAKVRLLPRRKDVFFTNPVHELVEDSLKKAKIPIYPCKIIVHHYGKLDMEREAKKDQDYYLLGKIKYESDPTNMKYIYELAKQAHLLHKYEETVELWQKLLSLIETDKQSSSYQEIVKISYGDPLPEIYIQLASAYLLLDRYEEALMSAVKTIDAKVKRKEYVVIYAHCEVMVGSLEKASRALQELAKTTTDYPPAMLLMAVIFCLEGKNENARELFQLLRQKGVQITTNLNKFAKQLYTNNKIDEAMLILNAVIENKICNEETTKLLKEIDNKK